ncbi:hypothetical protein LX32DRAFT_336891 [Colletotrichum zoysiae]|uniref:Uncharacterized protein n=1 Tax=Colletotrichum zoysiae TaxID=1216348 RepID=A0AAD9HKU9_9PEZI|nr:hypothetical protein LX32DRAFT_336891 [Colletotrichum zoysiae]
MGRFSALGLSGAGKDVATLQQCGAAIPDSLKVKLAEGTLEDYLPRQITARRCGREGNGVFSFLLLLRLYDMTFPMTISYPPHDEVVTPKTPPKSDARPNAQNTYAMRRKTWSLPQDITTKTRRQPAVRPGYRAGTRIGCRDVCCPSPPSLCAHPGSEPPTVYRSSWNSNSLPVWLPSRSLGPRFQGFHPLLYCAFALNGLTGLVMGLLTRHRYRNLCVS